MVKTGLRIDQKINFQKKNDPVLKQSAPLLVNNFQNGKT